MEKLIKTLISLFFLFCSFWLGQFLEHEKQISKINKLKVKSEFYEKRIKSLNDSLRRLHKAKQHVKY
jgi:chaperonin cofactor prefoldin